ncbi:MAG: methyltransferase domain-containing protein [Deltaproteobacteria bacterium]|nr:methyltransferase domain-containing protein [Deltaproteobacteria bacterium]
MADPARRRAPRAPFGERYAALYDELYADKDYAAECRYLERLFARFGARRVRSVLSLGCGTGGHDLILARKGLRVTGVDRSPGMLAAYRAKAAAAGIVADVVHGDVRSVRLERRFDAVISMFAVIGYQVGDADLAGALATAAAHLAPCGLFVFDVWYGPAVLADPPRDRTKTVATG